MSADEAVQQEKKPAAEPYTVERVRQWECESLNHGGRAKPVIYVPPEKLPDPCHTCGGEDWRSKGVVRRVKETGTIIPDVRQ